MLGQNGRPLKTRPVGRKDRPQYLQAALYGDEGRCHEYVHRLVLETFVGPRPDGMEARHLNGDCQDNRVENLIWGTPLENGADKIRHHPNCSRCHRPLEGRNKMMKNNGKRKVRACRSCHNERTLARYHEQKEMSRVGS